MLAPLGCLGGMIPTYAGFAWALKMQGSKEVVVAFHGDGGCSEGAAYEGWNLAALSKAPILYVIENNGWAMTVPLERQTVNPNISDRAAAMGLPATIIDGNNILEVREAVDKGLEMARAGQPNVIEMKTVRWDAHFVGQGNDYRHDMDIVKESMENDDCLKNFEKYLLENNVCDQKYMDDLKDKLGIELDEMVERAVKAPIPVKEDIYVKEQIYATSETGGEL